MWHRKKKQEEGQRERGKTERKDKEIVESS